MATLTEDRATQLTSIDHTFLGYHQFQDEGGKPYGSFEVFHTSEYAGPTENPNDTWETGFYWWPCFPGCTPEGEAIGPFPTSEGAYLDAIED